MLPANVLQRLADKELRRMLDVLRSSIDSDRPYDAPHKAYWKIQKSEIEKELRSRARHGFRVNKYGRSILEKAKPTP